MFRKILANAICVPTNRINAIVRGQRGITADTDLRLTKYFRLSKGYFLRLQSNLELLEQGRKIEKELNYSLLKKIQNCLIKNNVLGIS